MNDPTCRFGHECTSDCQHTKDCPCIADHCCALTPDCEGCDDHYEKPIIDHYAPTWKALNESDEKPEQYKCQSYYSDETQQVVNCTCGKCHTPMNKSKPQGYTNVYCPECRRTGEIKTELLTPEPFKGESYRRGYQEGVKATIAGLKRLRKESEAHIFDDVIEMYERLQDNKPPLSTRREE